MPTPSWNTQSTLPSHVRSQSVAILQQAVLDLIDLGLQAKHAHWNVKGPAFIALHELFDEVAEELTELADIAAERAVALGGIVMGTVQAVGAGTRVPSYPGSILAGSDHVRSLGAALAAAGQNIRSAIDEAGAQGDADTADVFTQISRSLDLLLWKVESHNIGA